MKLFGKAKTAPTPKETIARMKDTLEMLSKRESYLQKKIDNEKAIAKANATKNKKAALKRKKLYETQKDKIAGARTTIEMQVIAIENSTVNVEVIQALQLGASTMRAIHKNMRVEDVDNTMEEIREQMDVANEISDAISQPLGEAFDEDELEAELQALEEETLDETLLGTTAKLPSAPQVALEPKMPAVPTTVPSAAPAKTPAKAMSDEDADLKALEESMAM